MSHELATKKGLRTVAERQEIRPQDTIESFFGRQYRARFIVTGCLGVVNSLVTSDISVDLPQGITRSRRGKRLKRVALDSSKHAPRGVAYCTERFGLTAWN
jgi:hypothetical protein